MRPRSLFKVGMIGSVIAALCCFTPLLEVILGAIGLSALVGYLDMVLVPALVLFILITLIALYRMRGSDG